MCEGFRASSVQISAALLIPEPVLCLPTPNFVAGPLLASFYKLRQLERWSWEGSQTSNQSLSNRYFISFKIGTEHFLKMKAYVASRHGGACSIVVKAAGSADGQV